MYTDVLLSVTLLVIILFIFYIVISKRSKRFYEVAEVYPRLEDISAVREKILDEVKALPEWIDWPEKNLWDPGKTGAKWTIFPLRAFGRTVHKNCERTPTLAKFIDEMDREYGVRVAILSKLGPGMKLVPHQGWGGHCNRVLRCHYGISVPDGTSTRNCNIQVADEITDKCTLGSVSTSTIQHPTTQHINCYDGYDYELRRHYNDKWLVFDDSKMHTAENMTADNRIVLILDLQRPWWVPAGTSTVEDTAELEELLSTME